MMAKSALWMRALSVLPPAVLAAWGLGPCRAGAQLQATVFAGTALDPVPPQAALVRHPELGLCSAALVDTCLVLTAKHCVQPSGAPGPAAPEGFTVSLGVPSIASPTPGAHNGEGTPVAGTWAIRRVITGLGDYRAERGQAPMGALFGEDVAFLVLAAPVNSEGGAVEVPGEEAVQAVPWPLQPARAEQPFAGLWRVVGYGLNETGEPALRQRLTPLTNRSAWTLLGPSTTCVGDSGGPLLSTTGEVIAVASFGRGGCGQGPSGFSRLDRFAEMVPLARAHCAACDSPLSEERCDLRDNDCDGLVDEECARLGQGCSGGPDCVSGQCLAQEGGAFCTKECDASRPFVGCDGGMVCVPSAGTAADPRPDEPADEPSDDGATVRGHCVLDGNPSAMLGESCTASTQCSTRFCAPGGSCQVPCRSDDVSCLPSERCVPLAGAGRLGTCQARDDGREAESEAPREATGSPCERDAHCLEGHRCRSERSGKTCQSPCLGDAECPAGLACLAGWCRATLGVLGDACQSDSGCLSGRCLSAEDFAHRQSELQHSPPVVGYCTRGCAPQTPCATGFVCSRNAAGQGQCLARSALEPHGNGVGCSVAWLGAHGLRTAGWVGAWPSAWWAAWLAVAAGLGLVRRRRYRMLGEGSRTSAQRQVERNGS